MGDDISREKVLDMLDSIEEEVSTGQGFQYAKWREYICNLKEETAEWIYDPNGMDWSLPAWVCSNCRQKNDMIPTIIQYPGGARKVVNPYTWAGSKYCPNCGMEMSGKKDLGQKAAETHE